MEVLIQFYIATDYFLLRRDTRVFTLSFILCSCNTFKMSQHNVGSAADETETADNE